MAGWTLEQVMLTSGIAVFAHSCTEIFLEGLNHLHKRIRVGILDQMLVKPRSILFQVICSDFQSTKIGRLIESILLIVLGLFKAKISWTFYKIIAFIFVIIGSLTIFSALLIIKATFCFWALDGMELMNILTEGGRDLSKYPISIYNEKFAKFFTYVIPFGMVNYFPLVYIFDKQTDAPLWFILTPIASVIFLGIALLAWKKGIASYKSTGS